mmetsp:Transcript_2424/g.4873  ORF Transcript_2424/g.4873 Transcript_2424/m.4873 type:complete len:411 (-) Transcript_2424:228-1460(-)|eukprot:CAMPEP_0114237512 /NCGR_PEP_ID=MMETSP0058-20121206/7431_1 /TAXON_ID=36894 /ORGANISM="Pyramimonas parkeae, CCMP726" /LENGTH=410 /DNA_ID=CAMNT_0001349561 /DNA_START=145 /DNA_END=1377 /DNA_ORIENTATION=+
MEVVSTTSSHALLRAEATALRAMWKRLPSEGLDEAMMNQCTEQELLRFLRARCLDVNAAAASLADYKKWRVHFCVDQLRLSDVQSELEQGILCLQRGADRSGCPIMTVSMCRCRPPELHLLPFSMAFTYLMERALRTGPAVGILVDYTDAKLANCDLRVLRLIMDMSQNRYPEQVAYLLMCHSPPYFKQVWDAVSPYTEPWIMSKVHVLVKEDCLSRLETFIERANIPQSLGGLDVHSQSKQMSVWAAEETSDRPRHAAGLGSSPCVGSPPRSIVDNKIPADNVQDASTARAGFMIKQGGRVKNWKKRFFVLKKDGQLQYFKSAKAIEPKGVIWLSDLCNAGVDTSSTHRPHTIALKTPSRIYYFTCQDESEMHAWIEVLNQTAAMFRADISKPPLHPTGLGPQARNAWI